MLKKNPNCMSRSVEEANGLGFKGLPPFLSTTCRFVIAKMGQWVGSGRVMGRV